MDVNDSPTRGHFLFSCCRLSDLVSVGIKYEDLAYGVAHGFATMGTNNGHNGTTAASFYQNDDVAVDFAWRAYVYTIPPISCFRHFALKSALPKNN